MTPRLAQAGGRWQAQTGGVQTLLPRAYNPPPHYPPPHTAHHHQQQRQQSYLMDGHTVVLVHLIKLVNANNATVCQHHGTSLQPLVTCLTVA